MATAGSAPLKPSRTGSTRIKPLFVLGGMAVFSFMWGKGARTELGDANLRGGSQRALLQRPRWRDRATKAIDERERAYPQGDPYACVGNGVEPHSPEMRHKAVAQVDIECLERGWLPAVSWSCAGARRPLPAGPLDTHLGEAPEGCTRTPKCASVPFQRVYSFCPPVSRRRWRFKI